jgi:hypothetical protein
VEARVGWMALINPIVMAGAGRPSTSFHGERGKGVDGRHKAGHDGCWSEGAWYVPRQGTITS